MTLNMVLGGGALHCTVRWRSPVNSLVSFIKPPPNKSGPFSEYPPNVTRPDVSGRWKRFRNIPWAFLIDLVPDGNFFLTLMNLCAIQGLSIRSDGKGRLRFFAIESKGPPRPCRR